MDHTCAFRILAAFCACLTATIAVADASNLPTCETAPRDKNNNFASGPDCTISWVQNNKLQTIIWTEVTEDFAPAVLRYARMDARDIGDNYPNAVLQSSWLPELIDIDRDGWLDLVTFTRAGMVNGPFDIFFYNPESSRFDRTAQINGHTLARDTNGYLIVAARNGAATVESFYKVGDGELTFLFEVNPYGLGRSGEDFGPYCDVSRGYKQPLEFADLLRDTSIPDARDFFAYYCDAEGRADRSRRSVRLQEEHAQTDRVPADTVFYCILEGGTHAVTIADNQKGGLRYSYGPLDQLPELVVDRAYDQVNVLPDNGAGPSRFGEVSFTNGAYEYVAYYTYELFDATGALIDSGDNPLFPNDTFRRGLTVYRDNDVANPVFAKYCQLDRSYDAIFWYRPL